MECYFICCYGSSWLLQLPGHVVTVMVTWTGNKATQQHAMTSYNNNVYLIWHFFIWQRTDDSWFYVEHVEFLHMFLTDVFLHGGRGGESMTWVHALDSYVSSAERTHHFGFCVFHSNVWPDLVVLWLLDTAAQIGAGMDSGLPLPTDVLGSQIFWPYHGEHLHGLKVVAGLIGGQEDLLQVSPL